LEGGDRRQRYLGAARRAGQIEVVERIQRADHRGLQLVDHPILVGLGIDRGDDALAERVVQQIVDGRRGDAEARGGVAVDLDEHREPLALELARHVDELRDIRQARYESRYPGVEI